MELAIKITNRDGDLLRSLLESRVMTAAQVAALFFDGRREAAKKRLQKLKAAGYLAERGRKAYEPAVLHIARRGLILLRDEGILNDYPPLDLPVLERRARVSDQTVRHELEIMDVKTAFHAALKSTKRFTLAEFTTWPLLYQFEAFRPGYSGTEVTVKPDGFLRIREQEAGGGVSEHTFFLEVDRSTETLDTLVARAGCYLDYYRSGGFALRHGAPRSAFKDYPFRVLMVFKTAERRNNLAERLLQSTPPILTHVCLSTLEAVTTDPLAQVWMRPLDYREAVKGTPYDCERRNPPGHYRRETERDQWVSQRVKFFPLLA